jgi:YebC/PmpR family DNA-binding regulatory protein
MAGHSKWANIKHRKGRQDAKRAKFWTKILREVQVAAKLGGPDAESNPRLRVSLVDARNHNIPKDTIKRAIEKGAGMLEGQDFVELVYEGYGPGGIAMMVECLSDNRNRTAANVRSIFAKAGGNLGAEGSVAYLFTKQGKIWFDGGDTIDLDSLMMGALEAGAEDAEEEEGGLEITCGAYDIPSVQEGMENEGFAPSRSEVVQVPATTVSVDIDTARKTMKLIDKLEDDDDVQRVSSNLELTDEVALALSEL